LKITRRTHTSKSSVGDLTTAAKTNLDVVNNDNNDINNLLHDKDTNKFLKSHVKEQAKSSAKHILGNLYNNIYNAPQPQPPQSHADKPTLSIEMGAFDSYINDVDNNDIKCEGYEGIKTLLLANDTLEKEGKTGHC